MATIDEIRGAIRTRLKTISGLNVLQRVPETLDPDSAVVRYAGTIFDTTTSRGSDDQNYIVQIFTTKASDRGQDALYAYCEGTGDRSVKAVLGVDPTLGGLVMYADVTEVREPGEATPGGVPMYSVEIVVGVCVAP